MSIPVMKRCLFVLIVLSLLGACGDLSFDFLLPSNEAYHIRATINGGFLEDCSLVWAGDQISPYFASLVLDDPDLTGMAVFLEDAFGEAVGGTVKYLLYEYVDDFTLMEYELGLEGDEFIPAKEQTEAAEEGYTGDDLFPGSAFDELTYDDTLVIVRRLDRVMPDFTIPAHLKIGEYTLVFQALGKNDVLHRAETSVFYLGNAELSLKDIQLYFPGVSSGSRLIPPETTLMLEACLDFDKRLDPYIVWYYGRERISEGKLSDGAGIILWKAPKQTGFHSVRAEVFPFHILQRGISGISRDVSVPVSSKAVNTGFFFNDFPPIAEYPHEVVLQYLFDGSLEDSVQLTAGDRSLTPAGYEAPRWTPLDYSYGLAAGPEDEYTLPPVSFRREEDETGGGQLLLHFVPVSDGSILSALFPSQTGSGEDVQMHLYLKEGNTFVLRLSAPGGAAVETSVFIMSPETDSYTAAVIDFFMEPDLLEAKLSLGKDMVKHSNTISVSLPNPLSGKGRIRLGGPDIVETAEITVFEQQPEPEPEVEMFEFADFQPAVVMEDIPNTVINMTRVIWDELTILYIPPAIAEEEMLPEEEEAVEEETLPAEEEETEEEAVEEDEILPAEEEIEEETVEDNTPAATAEPQSAAPVQQSNSVTEESGISAEKSI